MGDLLARDHAIGDAVARWRDTAMMNVLGSASDITDQWQLFGICAGTTAVGLLRRDRRMAGTDVRMIAAMLLATMLENVVKDRVDGTRPFGHRRGHTSLSTR